MQYASLTVNRKKEKKRKKFHLVNEDPKKKNKFFVSFHSSSLVERNNEQQTKRALYLHAKESLKHAFPSDCKPTPVCNPTAPHPNK